MEEPSARHEFSVIAFAFQFYGIVPEYLNEAPKEVLKVRQTFSTTIHAVNRHVKIL